MLLVFQTLVQLTINYQPKWCASQNKFPFVEGPRCAKYNNLIIAPFQPETMSSKSKKVEEYDSDEDGDFVPDGMLFVEHSPKPKGPTFDSKQHLTNFAVEFI